MHKVLNEKDPSLFSTSPYWLQKDANEVHLSPLDKTYNFREMEALRVAREIEQLDEVELANIGVSAFLFVHFQRQDYLALVVQHKPEMGLPYAKLVSGFVETPHLKQPGQAIEKELHEEVLMYDAKGQLLTIDYQMQAANGEHKVFIDGELLEGSPEIRVMNHTNSAQLIYRYAVDLDSLSPEVFSIFHAEEMFNANKNVVETLLYEHGLLLVRIEEGKLTRDAFNLHEGELQQFDLSTVKVSPYVLTTAL